MHLTSNQNKTYPVQQQTKEGEQKVHEQAEQSHVKEEDCSENDPNNVGYDDRDQQEEGQQNLLHH